METNADAIADATTGLSTLVDSIETQRSTIARLEAKIRQLTDTVERQAMALEVIRVAANVRIPQEAPEPSIP